MSFYVLEVISSRWSKNLSGYNPYRITWENSDSGQKICEIFIKMVIDSELGNTDPHENIHVGFHFYKYDTLVNFNLKPSDRPNPISNVYIPSRPYIDMNINKIVEYSLRDLESIKNGSIITGVSEEELNQVLKEIESEV